MKLTIKVTNVFFGLFAIISLFMPIVGYKTMLMGQEYSLLDMINLLKGYDASQGQSLLKNLAIYGYKTIAILTIVFFGAMLLFLLVSIILAFTNVPAHVMCITSFLGFGSYVTASVLFCRIGAGFVSGKIPVSAITSLNSNSDILSTLISSFASVSKMGITTGAWVGMICLGIMFVVNVLYFIFRKKINLMDGKSAKKAKKH